MAASGSGTAAYALSPDLNRLDSVSHPVIIAQRATPTTYVTRLSPDTIVVQITDGNFFFRDEMYRSYGNSYQATDHGIRVMYDGDSDRVVVISDETGEEFYNYFFDASFSNSNDLSEPSGGYAQPTPETYLTRENANEYTAELIEGEFYFYGPLTRTSGNTFVGSDAQIRVMYDADTSRMVVINVVTGTEFYNYFFSTVDEGYL
ncbi:MAG: hypothetical protein F6K00_19225 [Leptolyngbya sp. SIOISBB]|nr:hypothetical protein [Leptolyngbya sp. SIOISBB]